MKKRAVSEFESNYITSLLCVYQGNVTRAAKAARKDRGTFWAMIRKHNINVDRFRTSKNVSGE
jgi:DNA-binding NtrC family response regulator